MQQSANQEGPPVAARHGLHATFLDASSIERIHEATLRVLERVGIELDSPGLCDRLSAAGASVQGGRVRLPRDLVARALAVPQAPLILAGRAGDRDLLLDGSRSWLSVDGCASEILDPGAQESRPSTLADIASLTRLADALPEIGFVWQPVAARDVPVPTKPLHELRAQLGATTKHITMMTAVTPQAAEGVVEIARMVAGGDATLRARPPISSFQCSLSPLAYEGQALEAAVILARAGIPSGFVVMPITCATAPATAFGTLVTANAEVLAGIVMLRALVPEAPTFYGACPTVMDLMTGAAACGGPEDFLFQMAGAEMARHYRLPAMIGTFATGSRRSDWQAGLENGLSGIASLLSGAELLTGAGLLEAARVCSPEQLVLDAEAFGLMAAMTGGPAHDGVAAEPIDAIVELLGDVGPRGHFLDRDHTLEHMAEIWRPRNFHREDVESWKAAGRPGPRERARALVEEILAEPATSKLSPELDAELARLIESFQRQAGPVEGNDG